MGLPPAAGRVTAATGRAPTIRPFTPTEVAAARSELLTIAVEAKGSWGYDAAFMARFRSDMDAELVALAGRSEAPVNVLAAEAAGRLIGFAVVRDAGDRACLDDLWVAPADQGLGAGRALWEASLALARRWGRATIELEADPNAVGFYERMGAQVVGSRPSTYEPGRKLPCMRATIASALGR